MSITVTQLSANLPTGVTLDPTAYPGTAQAIKVLTDMLDAFNKTQAEFNAAAPAGTDVLSLGSVWEMNRLYFGRPARLRPLKS